MVSHWHSRKERDGNTSLLSEDTKSILSHWSVEGSLGKGGDGGGGRVVGRVRGEIIDTPIEWRGIEKWRERIRCETVKC